MKSKLAATTALGLLGLLGACGGGGASSSASSGGANTPSSSGSSSTSSSDDISRVLTQGQLKVAHYATGDGMVGLVFDRTGPKPKLRMDGEKDVLELTIEEERDAGDRTGWFFRVPAGHRVLYLGVNGNMKVFTPSNSWGLRITSDRAAEPLPAATVLAPASTTSTSGTTAGAMKGLAAISVRARFPQFKPEESANLAKVAEALQLAKPDMFVHVTAKAAKQTHWAPASNHIGEESRGPSTAFYGLVGADETWDKSKPGLVRFGVKLAPNASRYPGPTRLELRALKGWDPTIAPNTPGLVWETEPKLVFVSVDGGRYQFDSDDPSQVEGGWGAPASWPTAPQHAAIDYDVVRVLSAGHAIPEQTTKELEALEDAWAECVSDVWKSAKTEVEKVDASQQSADLKRGQRSGIISKAEQSVLTKCAGMLKQCEVGLTKLVESRNVERLAMFDKARARAH